MRGSSVGKPCWTEGLSFPQTEKMGAEQIQKSYKHSSVEEQNTREGKLVMRET